MIPEKMKKVLELNSKIAELSKIFTYAHNFIYLGRGYSYPVALEGALKLKRDFIHSCRRVSRCRNETWSDSFDRC